MNTVEEFAREKISKIKVDRSNLDFIASSGKINGSLLLSLIDLSKDVLCFSQRWIPVKEGLPEINSDLFSDLILITTETGKIHVGYYHWNIKGNYFITNDGHDFYEGYITHWRPIEFK